MINVNDINYLHKCTKCNIEKPNSEYTRKNTDSRKRKYKSSCKECGRDDWKKYANTLTRKIYKLKYFFDLKYEDWLLLVEKQGNKCAICKKSEDMLNRNLAIDHCHITGKVRGLLCNSCNLGLGKFEDNVELLKVAIKYIEENK